MKKSLGFVACAALLLSACIHEEDDMHVHSHEVMYQITLTNLSNHQPLTPPAAILHDGEYQAWQLGNSASEGLEKLAEGGDTSGLIANAMDNMHVMSGETMSSAPFGPGESVTATLEIDHAEKVVLSLASMLANTNDAFTGVDGLDLSALAAGESISVMTMVFDAGTEDNSEAAGTIPGPVDGGTGYDAARSSKDFVTIHPGVVTADDGLTSSVLNESHRWLGPVAKLEVTRM